MDRALFRLALRLTGGYFVISAGQAFITDLEWTLAGMMNQAGSPGAPSPFWTCWEFGKDISGMAIGVYLLFAGRWILDRYHPHPGPRCRKCGYNLTGAPGPCCPECGTSMTGEGVSK